MSKHAIEGFTDSLARQLTLDRVTLIKMLDEVLATARPRTD
jgi:hypothetical protein